MSLIIIEGPDGGGKTTLVNRLRRELPGYLWILQANGKGKPNQEEIMESTKWIDWAPSTVICDRHPLISELVYGEILRAEVRHSFSIDDIARRLSHALIIYCRPPKEILFEGVQAEEQFKGVHDHYRRIIGYYDTVMSSLARSESGIRVVEYNWRDSRMRSVELVRKFIAEGPNND